MNEKQKLIIKIAVAAVVGMLAFPPFSVRLPNNAVVNLGYGFLFDPPARGYYQGTVDVGLLLVQWLAVFVIAGVLWWMAKDSQK